MFKNNGIVYFRTQVKKYKLSEEIDFKVIAYFKAFREFFL